MREILPGIYHWTTFHEGIEDYVHSYCIACVVPAVLIDPRVPEEGLEWFEQHTPPEHVYLTNRHHYRHGDQFQKAFGSTIWCHRSGLHEFGEDKSVKPFEHGETLPGDILALEVGVLCPEETAFHIPCSSGVLSIGDAIIRADGQLGFVPDYLMGDDPDGVKRGLCQVFHGHIEGNSSIYSSLTENPGSMAGSRPCGNSSILYKQKAHPIYAPLTLEMPRETAAYVTPTTQGQPA